MKTRKEAEARAIELFPPSDSYVRNAFQEIAREAFIQCWEEMQAYKQTCGFCVEPKEEQDYSDEEIKAMIDRMNEQPLQIIDTGCDQLREAAENFVTTHNSRELFTNWAKWSKEMVSKFDELEKALK